MKGGKVTGNSYLCHLPAKGLGITAVMLGWGLSSLSEPTLTGLVPS